MNETGRDTNDTKLLLTLYRGQFNIQPSPTGDNMESKDESVNRKRD